MKFPAGPTSCFMQKSAIHAAVTSHNFSRRERWNVPSSADINPYRLNCVWYRLFGWSASEYSVSYLFVYPCCVLMVKYDWSHKYANKLKQKQFKSSLKSQAAPAVSDSWREYRIANNYLFEQNYWQAIDSNKEKPYIPQRAETSCLQWP